MKTQWTNNHNLITLRSSSLKKAAFSLACLILTGILVSCSPKRPEPEKAYIPENYLAQSTLISFDRAALNEIPGNPYPTLSVPTYITKVEGCYFIVDCYHNQVIYHDNLTDPLYQWQVMTSDISMGHTLASDGLVYLIDDTENNRILVMERDTNENGQTVFVPTQEFTGIGNRPHYIIYDDYTDTFYAWSSMSGEMYLFRHPEGDPRMYLTEVRSIPALRDVYVRSFTIVEDTIFFVSGTPYCSVLEADLYSFEIKKEYPVPSEIAGMIPGRKFAAADAYMMGMFSTLDYMVNAPLKELLDEIPVPDEVKVGLLTGEGIPGKVQKLVIAYEHADWKSSKELAEELGIPSKQLAQIYVDCVEEVNNTWNNLMTDVEA